MRILFLILLSFLNAFAFELVLNTGRENNQAFAVLHASNDLEFYMSKNLLPKQKFILNVILQVWLIIN